MNRTIGKTLILVLVFATLVSAIHRLTKPTIDRAQTDYVARQLSAILPQGSFDPPLLALPSQWPMDAYPQDASIHLAKKDQRVVATLMDVTTPNGYSGDIRVLVAIDADGAVIAARVLAHRETPGLGDAIELQKSEWMNQFQGKSLATHPHSVWQPDRAGGDFDTISSATITSQAVTNAVANALLTYEKNKQAIWEFEP